MKRYLKLLLSVSILFTGSVIALYGQEIVSSSLSKDTILIGDQVQWITRFTLPQNMTIKIDSLSNPIVQGVELIGNEVLDTISMKKKMATIEARAIVTSFDSGSYYLPLRIMYLMENGKVSDTLEIPSQFLEVVTMPIDTATFEINDIKPQFTYPVTFNELLPWIGLLLAVVALAFLVYRFIKNRRENKSLFGKPIVKDPPHIVALRKLDKLRGEKLWQSHKQKQFYTSICDILRVYIYGRFHIKAMEQTSKEILEMLSKEKIEARDFAELKELMETADLVKFAKYTATDDENENAIPTAVRFVNATFVQELEEEKHG